MENIVQFLISKQTVDASEAKLSVNYLNNSCKESPSIKNGLSQLPKEAYRLGFTGFWTQDALSSNQSPKQHPRVRDATKVQEPVTRS